MIWGERSEDRVIRLTTPHLWFAWYPVTLTNGRRLWWQKIYRWADLSFMGSRWNYAAERPDRGGKIIPLYGPIYYPGEEPRIPKPPEGGTGAVTLSGSP